MSDARPLNMTRNGSILLYSHILSGALDNIFSFFKNREINSYIKTCVVRIFFVQTQEKKKTIQVTPTKKPSFLPQI